MRKLFIIFAILMVSTQVFSQKTDKEKIEELDTYFQEALESWEVPGMAIAIVKDGEIIFEKGYGITDINTKKAVDENTLFAVASNTKTFTATAIASLVDQGLLDWDDKVVEYLPWFKSYDPWVTANFTISDLLCHHSGLRTFSGDLLWYGTDYSRREVIERSSLLEPVYDFRTHFGYSNIHFVTAGEIIPTVCDYSWDEYIQKKFFAPLGMKRSLTTTNDLKKMKNVASPHSRKDGQTVAIDWINWDNVGPAGSIISSVHDYSQWLLFHLNKGIVNGDTIISERSQRELWQPHTNNYVSKGAERLWDTHFDAYGLGFSTKDYLGYKVVGHNGGYDGFISQSQMIPEKGIGFIILTNANSLLYFPLQYKILDVMLDNEIENDWSKMFVYLKDNVDQQETEVKEALAANYIPNTKPLALTKYVGTYVCDIYGSITVSIVDDKLHFSMDHTALFEADLEHYHYNTFTFRFENVVSLPLGTINFILNNEGEVSELEIDVPNPDFHFFEFEFVKKV